MSDPIDDPDDDPDDVNLIMERILETGITVGAELKEILKPHLLETSRPDADVALGILYLAAAWVAILRMPEPEVALQLYVDYCTDVIQRHAKNSISPNQRGGQT